MNPWSTLGIDVIILMLLAKDGQHYTASIRASIEAQGGQVNDTTIHMAFRRFEERKIVCPLNIRRQGSRSRPPKYFALTPEGQKLVTSICGIVQPILEALERRQGKAAS